MDTLLGFSSVERSARLVYSLMKLGMGGAVLHIGAHPDDEDTGLLSYLSCKYGVRAVYWSATRGEGGQNRIGHYSEEALGIYRTWESLDARSVDGGECLFDPFYDFGYSINAEKPFSKWGKENLVREIVRAIRMVQPHVVVSRWTGKPGDFHGHHQAVGQAALLAFDAAGDSGCFRELLSDGLAPWAPLKLYCSMDNSGAEQPFGGALNVRGAINPAYEKDGIVRINTGEFDPVAGITYQQRAWLACNHHKTQSFGLAPAPGDFFYYFSLIKSLVPVPVRESSIFDGLDPSLTGLADRPENGSLRAGLQQIVRKAAEALNDFKVGNASDAVPHLVEGLTLIREIRAALQNDRPQGMTGRALGQYLDRRIADFETVIAECSGIELECLSDCCRIAPGAKFPVSARLWNHVGTPLDKADFQIRLPQGWTAAPLEPGSTNASSRDFEKNPYPGNIRADFEITVPHTARLSCPYWLQSPRSQYMYNWIDGPCGHPFGPPLVEICCRVGVRGQEITLRKGVVSRQSFPGGFREIGLAVIPPITIHPKNNLKFLPVNDEDQELELYVAVQNNSGRPLEGPLELDAPAGWRVSPSRVDLSVQKPGEVETVRHSVVVPAGSNAGRHTLLYRVFCEGRHYDMAVNPVRMPFPGCPPTADESNCIREEFIVKPAAVEIHLVDVRFLKGLQYAYIQGVKEHMIEALAPFGIHFHLLSDEDLGYSDLSRFHAIIVGPNAYLVRDELRRCASRFLEYVKQGGTLIVQYQGYPYEAPGLAPYPFTFSRPHDRITYEDAPVTVLDREHTIFRLPNGIGPRDFEGWIKDRGLYFFGQWDKRYSAILSSADPGGKPAEGGMMECQYGRGNFVYTGYSFFRQLPAGVAGSFRLFANILALPEARILERVDFLRKLPLFSALSEEQLGAVARLIFERWVEDNSYLCRQGDAGDELYIIYKGRMEIVRQAPDGVHTFHAQKGDCIGELAVLGNFVRTASLRAIGDTQLLVIKGPVFMSLLQQYPEISIAIIRSLLDRYLAPQKDHPA